MLSSSLSNIFLSKIWLNYLLQSVEALYTANFEDATTTVMEEGPINFP